MAPRPFSLRTSFLPRFITDTEAEKSAIYGIIERFVEGEKANFSAGLN
jgi:hypothetical protein